MSKFFAHVSRVKYIERWSLKRNSRPENVQEHSWEVAVIVHLLAMLRNTYFQGQLDANKLVVAAIYHDVHEVVTGDLATPVKNFSPQIRDSYKQLESYACDLLIDSLPEELQQELTWPIRSQLDEDEAALLKAADTISAYVKCLEEINAGNHEFQTALDAVQGRLASIELPEVKMFCERFLPAMKLTVDELLVSPTAV
jgi:5'-deoxynucleotidase